jgi:Na+/phosphate symporter
MFSIQRWIKLLVLVLVLVAMATWAEEEVHHAEGNVEVEQAAEKYEEETVPEIIEAVDEQVDKEVQKEETNFAEDDVETTENMASTAVKATKDLFDNMKSKVTDAVDLIVSESKNVIERCKNMNKDDVKKVAAAAVGIWGVAVGVGYLTKGTSPPPPPPPTGKSATFAKKK